MFGEKDYQQLKVVTRMARDLDLPVDVVGVPTVREKDGLAMSSRNAYLSPAERKVAPVLHRALKDTARRDQVGEPSVSDAVAQGRTHDRARRLRARLSRGAPRRNARADRRRVKDGPIRLLVAAKIGTTRLIDNIRASEELQQTQLAQFAPQRFGHCGDARAACRRDRAAHPSPRDSASPGTRGTDAARPARISDPTQAGSGRSRPCR